MRSFFACLLFSAVILLPVSTFSANKDQYVHFRKGNPNDIVTKPTPGFMLMGGGDDIDAAFQWMCSRSGGGDFLVLRASGGDDYNRYIHKICKLNSVATIITKSRVAAQDKFVADAIRHAEAIFLSGGDQANYINFWKGTDVQTALNEAIARGVPIGGTSAGLAVLGEFSFAALNDTTYSKVTLADPFDRTVTIERNFLTIPILNGVITDTHFDKRDRLGRLLVFMSRIQQDGWAQRVRAIAVDERAALAIEPDGSATLFGADSIYFIQSDTSPSECRPKTPLSSGPFTVQRMGRDGGFNVKSWTGKNVVNYDLEVHQGKVKSNQASGSLY